MGTAVLEAGPRGDLTTAAGAVEAFCTAFDPTVLTATQAAEALVTLTVMERQVTAAKARAARRVEISSSWRHAGYRTMAEWMAAKTGEPVSTSAGLLDTAKQLESMPATAEAFAAGEVSQAGAREIAGAVAVDRAAEATLLQVAREGDHRQLTDRAARVRQAAHSAEDEAARHARLRRKRFLRTRTDADGLVILHGGFTPADWAPVNAALQRATDAAFARARRDGRREPVEAYTADALIGLLTAGDLPASGDAPATSTTGASQAAATPQAVGPPAAGAPPPRATSRPRPARPAQVVVLVDGIALRRGHLATGERCEIAGVGPVSVDWVRQLLPEALVDVLVHDGVDITTHASATRAIRKAVRLAVDARDGCCVVRGCGRARRTQRDHRHEHARGGLGSTANLELLCEFHHRQKSNQGARLERHGDRWHWYPPEATEPWLSPVGSGLTRWHPDVLDRLDTGRTDPDPNVGAPTPDHYP